MIIQVRVRVLLCAVGSVAAIGGALAALRYHRLGLTLSHYDARGHLVVARRIVDSITPGWQQIGAVWLPLPHLLNAVPVQVDWFYRTGASAVAISILSFAVATAAIAWIVILLTESVAAALVGAAAFALNPNVVYLQATPLSEPLLLALITLGVAMLIGGARPSLAGVVLALACLTRYEAWPATGAALAATAWARWRRGEALVATCRRVAAVAVYPTLAVAGFLLFSRVVVGEWFVSSGFFVPENKARGLPMVAVAEILWGVRQIGRPILVAAAAAGSGALVVVGLASRRRADWLIPLSMAAMAGVAWLAFVEGHPFRIRYMVPLVGFQAVAVGAFVGLLARVRDRVRHADAAAAILVALTIAYELRPLDPLAPMVVEAQWDQPNAGPREAVTACLRARYQGDTIMASMGSLGHYMQATARDGFNLRDFLHEGNGDIWLAALEGPRPYAGWVLIEEKAQGGDMLARRAREHPDFLAGYSRVCEGAGVALYERQNRMLNVNK